MDEAELELKGRGGETLAVYVYMVQRGFMLRIFSRKGYIRCNADITFLHILDNNNNNKRKEKEMKNNDFCQVSQIG